MMCVSSSTRIFAIEKRQFRYLPNNFPEQADESAPILWGAVLGTQVVATLIAVYGLFMTPLGWKWALFVWGYALSWFFVNDRLKLFAYWIIDRIKAEPKKS